MEKIRISIKAIYNLTLDKETLEPNGMFLAEVYNGIRASDYLVRSDETGVTLEHPRERGCEAMMIAKEEFASAVYEYLLPLFTNGRHIEIYSVYLAGKEEEGKDRTTVNYDMFLKTESGMKLSLGWTDYNETKGKFVLIPWYFRSPFFDKSLCKNYDQFQDQDIALAYRRAVQTCATVLCTELYKAIFNKMLSCESGREALRKLEPSGLPFSSDGKVEWGEFFLKINEENVCYCVHHLARSESNPHKLRYIKSTKSNEQTNTGGVENE